MDARQITSALQSTDESELLEAIYNIDESLSNNLEVISRLMELMLHESPDIREISIMRLACRLGNASILDSLETNLNDHVEKLVFSASVRGLGCIASASPRSHRDAMLALNRALSNSLSWDRLEIIKQTIADIEKYR